MALRGLGDASDWGASSSDDVLPGQASTWSSDEGSVSALSPIGTGALHSSYGLTAPPSSGGWGDFFSTLGKNILTGAAKGATSTIVGRLSPNATPAQVAAAQAADAARAAAERTKMLWIVGGVGAAVVVGALVLRRRRR